jgi:tRNA pseudouridine38-40 synthase
VRYFINLAYKGTNFHGWQVQPNAVSVQQRINEGLSVLLKEEVMIMGAGRTDAGVHAKQMYAHFDTDKSFDLDEVAYRLNAFLEDSIHIKSIFKVADETHARFHATSRTYEYWLCQQKNPFLTQGAWLMYSDLDFSLMNEAASYLIEESDFSSFAKIHSDVNTHICDVRKAEWVQQGDKWVFIIEADRFLRNMVRAIVGTLVEIGKKKMTLDEFKSVIKEKNRSSAGTSAPAKGLYLVKIEYPKELLNGDC